MLGFRLQVAHVQMRPCSPRDWPGYTVRYRRGSATYLIRVENPSHLSTGAVDIDVDGRRVSGDRFAVADDGREHRIDVRLREPDVVAEEPVVPEREPQVAGVRR